MRRFVPILIVIIGLLALVIDFWPGPQAARSSATPMRAPRVLETKLGLDLQGGLRVEYQALPDERRDARRRRRCRRSATSSSGG